MDLIVSGCAIRLNSVNERVVRLETMNLVARKTGGATSSSFRSL
jgi:hypothetical protein